MSKERQLFCPQRQKCSFSCWLDTTVAVINLARRCCYFYWTFGKILKEDTVMVFGNNSQVTAKEMDFPSGWQFIFAARGAWIYACSKSGFCQGWLSRDCEQSNRELQGEERFCSVVLCLSVFYRHKSRVMSLSLGYSWLFQELRQKFSDLFMSVRRYSV